MKFRVDDVDNPWVYGTLFDLVHTRLATGTIKSWPKYFADAFENIKPGGWVEAQEYEMDPRSDDASIPADSAILKWHKLWCEGMLKFGYEMGITCEKLKEEMEKAGFINVQAREFKLPFAPWSDDPQLKEVGLLMAFMMEDISGVSMAAFTRGLGWEQAEVEVFLTQVRKEWKNKNVHGYWPL